VLSGNVCVEGRVYAGRGNWHEPCVVHIDMARYDELRVPRGLSRKWEIIIDQDAGEVQAKGRTAADVKNEHRILREIPAEELSELPLAPEGASLQRGEWYLDLHNPARGEFPGTGREHVRPGQRVVARRSASKDLWRTLVDACDEVLGRARRGTAA